MIDRVGQQIGNYRLIRLLGEGGFAEVYLGEHLYLGSQAAIKLLHTHVTQSDIAQFQQEGRMLANLSHLNIVRILDFGVDDRTPYLIMDYAPGGTLRTRHPEGTRLPLSTVVQCVKQIGQALQYAHDQKFIHRDIKPENMLIGRNGDLLLSDFGIALIIQSARYQSTKDMAGTIAYMAPEQIEAHPRPASDQYSLGIVIYEWLCGERPFRGSLTEIAIKQSIAPPSSLVEQLPSLPPAVERVIFTALAKKPEDRFASIRSFVTALEQASTIEPPSITPAPPRRRPTTQSPPHAEERAKPKNQEELPATLDSPGMQPSAFAVSSPSRSSLTTLLDGTNVTAKASSPFPQRLSRRSVVAGLMVLVGAGGSVMWWTSTHVIPTSTSEIKNISAYERLLRDSRYNGIAINEIAGGLKLDPGFITHQLQTITSMIDIAASQGVDAQKLHSIELKAFTDVAHYWVQSGLVGQGDLASWQARLHKDPAFLDNDVTILFWPEVIPPGDGIQP